MIEYTVIGQEAFDRLVNGVWFELIDPRSDSDAPASQRISQGLTNASSLMVLGEGRYRLTQSIGRNELHDTYTLRAYELMTHERFGSYTFTVIPANE